MNLKQRYQGSGNQKRGVVIVLTRDKRHIRKRKKCYRDKEVYQARKINKRHPCWKRRTKTIFTYEIILCQENTNKYHTKTIRINKPFSKVVGYKIKVENSIVFLYTSHEQYEN